MMAKNGLPRERCGATRRTAGSTDAWPAGGDSTPRDGAVSHRQQAMRIANNIEEFSPCPPASNNRRSRAGIPYQCFKEPLGRGPARHRQQAAGNLRT
jgi:hypothetical protein